MLTAKSPGKSDQNPDRIHNLAKSSGKSDQNPNRTHNLPKPSGKSGWNPDGTFSGIVRAALLPTFGCTSSGVLKQSSYIRGYCLMAFVQTWSSGKRAFEEAAARAILTAV